MPGLSVVESKQRFFKKKRAKNFCWLQAFGPEAPLIASSGGD
jgi:hypothetical protein